MTISVRDYTIINLVQATHYQGDVNGIQCSCMSLISASLTIFKPSGLQDKFYLDYMLGKGDQLFKCIRKFKYLGMQDLPQDFLTENSSVNVEFLENKKGEITAGTYLLSIAETVNGVQ